MSDSRTSRLGGGGSGGSGDWTPLGVTTSTVGGITSGTNLGTSPISIESTLRDELYPYSGPTVSLGISPSAGIREFGNPVAAPVLTPVTVANSDPITTLTLTRSGVGVIQTYSPPNPAGGSEAPYTDIGGAVTTNTTYTATVGDGTSTGTATRTYSFVYPIYYGVGAQGLTGAQVGALTKLIQSPANVTLAFSPTNQVYYYAQLASAPLITSILDTNGFETFATVTPDWTVRIATITGLDATPQSYRIYEFNNLTTQVAFNNTFRY